MFVANFIVVQNLKHDVARREIDTLRQRDNSVENEKLTLYKNAIRNAHFRVQVRFFGPRTTLVAEKFVRVSTIGDVVRVYIRNEKSWRLKYDYFAQCAKPWSVALARCSVRPIWTYQT